MNILFDHPNLFLLAHGGVQVQIEQTKLALERAKVEVEFAHWWDAQQQADIIHYFGPIPNAYLRLARQKRIPVVLTSFFSSTCNRSDFRLRLQGLVTRGLLAVPGWDSIKTQLQWRSYAYALRVIVGTQAERRVLQMVYGIPAPKISVVPLGLEEIYLANRKARQPGNHLISVGTIRDVKRSIELAQLARNAEVPILFVGNPYSTHDPYWQRFQRMIDSRFVLYRDHVCDSVELMNLLLSARGFVLYSRYENWSLATHEAAACGLPLLLPDMKWSRECFADQAVYFSSREEQAHAAELKDFYVSTDRLPPPKIKHYSWNDVARRLVAIYQGVLSTAK
jgi:glycosyltransferase involved in cell wall biosynthesis